MTFLELSSFLAQYFGKIWWFLSGVTIPVIEVSAAHFMIGVFLARFSIHILGKVIGSSPNISNSNIYNAKQFYNSNKKG